MSAITRAADLIKASEGCRLKAYLCPAKVWTVGYGATGPDVTDGTVWTQAQADDRLLSDMSKATAAVERLVTVPLSDGQKAALISFVFNLGPAALAGSTLLRLLNAGRPPAEVAEQFGRWVYAKGRLLPGLVTRREAEKLLFLKE